MKKVIVILMVSLLPFFFSGKAVASLSTISDIGMGMDLESNEQVYKVTFFPNPVTNKYFTVNASHKIKTVKIFNVIGQEVQREENIDLTKKLLINLDFSEKGIYLVKVVFDDNHTVVNRLLIK